MEFNQDPVNTLVPLPAKNIDTGMGLSRMAMILQDVPSIFETDELKPLIELGEELSGRRYGEAFETDRALRILADHSRGMCFLVADGVVPSNEDRGYILRRVMRRAIQQGRVLGLQAGFLPRYADVVEQAVGPAYPELVEQRGSIRRWLTGEEENFGRTLEHGTKLLEDLIAQAKEAGAEGIASEDAFRLHDTYGFPIDLTLELVAEHGLGVDEEGFEALMDDQRQRARATARAGLPDDAARERGRQAGSYVGPDKLRFDFTHGQALTPEELRDVEDRVNEWVLANRPVRALTTTLDEARRLGAMALFGEKYGDVVRMVEVGDGSFSRELCGGTHVRSTAEIALFKIASETSSAANVRRIEALTGPEAVRMMRRHDRALEQTARTLRVQPDGVPEAVAELRERVRELERASRSGAGQTGGVDVDRLAAHALEQDGA